ncbi:MAG: AEC family transporter [Rhodoferax sp.]|uniref:AEC family transporter n=1 Tax=Rhodoferax sp. TaxID=50421 RepID=UPI001B57818E|nr:AEC family transporter [Rhodoferax sp.]MBP9904818.1 AEC family transporter [Rhodoferax sp.]
MIKIFTVTFPFFALVLAGYLAARRRYLPLEAIPGLNGFVLFFALPCMLYRFGAMTPVSQLLDLSVALTWLLCGLTVVGLTVAFSLNPRIGWNDAAFGALVAAFPNSGFMGVPLLVALLGPQAAGPTILSMAIDMLVITSLCIALSRLDGADQHGAAKALRRALQGVLTNPMPWAILLGAMASVLAFELPAPVAKVVGMLADAASPVALFTIGAVLARSQMLAASGHAAAPVLRDYLPVALVKLFLHPLLLLLVGAALIQLGLPLERSAWTVLVLVAALPSASNVSLLAERFGADNGRVARIILLSTAAAFVTFSLTVALLLP